MEEENNKENQENKSKGLYSIRTFKTDASEFMQKGEVSATDLFVKDQKPIAYNIEEGPRITGERNKKTIFIGIAAAGVLFLGFSAYFIWGRSEAPNTGNNNLTAPKPLLVSEGLVVLDSKNKSNFIKELQDVLAKQNTPGDLIYLPVKKQVGTAVKFLNTNEFLNSLGISAPAFLTNFLEDNFFLGSLNLQEKHLVLIIEVQQNQYDNAFSGMIRWEKTLLQDLDFIANRGNLDDSSFVTFKDSVIKNQDARVARTEKGDVLVYTFINRNFIIITDNQSALEEIIRRFVLYKFS